MSTGRAESLFADGPVHKLVVLFDMNRFRGEILPELERLKELDIIRVVDLLGIRKDRSGALAVITATDLDADEATEFGRAIGTLIGLGLGGAEEAAEGALIGAEALADGHLLDAASAPQIAEQIPNDSTVVIALLEHRWAIPLREKISRAGGSIVEEDWIGAEDLIAIGLRAAAKGESGALTADG
jgi:hypothetical protein